MAFRLEGSTAHTILSECNATQETDFHTLRSDDLSMLLAWTVKLAYRKPKNANGSKGRSFFAYVQKAARQPEAFDHKYEPGAYGVCRRCGSEKH